MEKPKINLSETLKKAGNFVKENPKPLLYLGGAIAITVIGYAIVKKAKGGIETVFSDKTKSDTPFTKITFDEKLSTITDSVANNYANQLFNAMRNSGTDENTIYSVLQKLQKKEDFLKVYNAFGKKSYGKFLDNGEPNLLNSTIGFFGGYDNIDLIEWLRKEVGILNYPTYSLIKKTVNNAGLAF